MLDLNLGVMLIEAGIFLITMVLLKKWLFDPIVKFMDEREEKLKKELEMIEKNSEDTKAIEEEINKILSNAREEASKIVHKAKEEALAEANSLKLKQEEEINKAKEELAKELQKQKEEILKELLKEKDEIKSLIQNKIRKAA